MHSNHWANAGRLTLLVTGLTSFGPSYLVAAPADGATMFKAKCAMCHGADASGSTPMGQKMKTPDLRSPEVQKQTDAELTAVIVGGKPPMPPYGKTLAAGDIEQLVAYVRSVAKKS